MSIDVIIDELETALNTDPTFSGTLYFFNWLTGGVNGVPAYPATNIQVLGVQDVEVSTGGIKTRYEFALVNRMTSDWIISKAGLKLALARTASMSDIMASFIDNLSCDAWNDTEPSYKQTNDGDHIETIATFSITIDKPRA